MNHFLRVGLVLGLVSLWPTSNSADDARERLERGKAATAFVEMPDENNSATAVCIAAKGLFVTNHHVVKHLPKDGTLALVLDPNGEKPRELKAKVLRSDPQSDLSLLQVQDAPATFTFLSLGDDQALFETMPVTSYGYPFGKVLAGTGTRYPDISVSVGRITALRKREGNLDRIQLDATLNPGNSGGPVCDEKGMLIGIVQAGLLATGVNFAIPVTQLRTLLAKPLVTFQPPKISDAVKHEETELEIFVEPFQRPLDQAVVELEINRAGQPPRKFIATTLGENKYGVRIVPVPPSSPAETVWIAGSVIYAQGGVQGGFADQPVKVGEETMQLADIRSVEWAGETTVTRHNGKTSIGALSGLEKLEVNLGDARLQLDLTQAKRFELRPIVRTKPAVTYVLTVKLENDELARQEGILSVEGFAGPHVEMSGAVKFVPYRGETQTIELPDTISDVVWGGGGRFLLLHMKKTRKVAVYDVNQGKIASYLSLGSENALIAAGMDKLIVVAPGENVIERWSLASFEKETTRPLPVNGVVKTISLGYGSDGPLLMHWAASSDALARAQYTLFDLEKCEEVKIEGFRSRNSSFRDAVHIRASGTGDVFGLWCTSHSPQGMETLVIAGTKAKSSYQHNSAGHIVPNYDGSAVLTGLGGVCTPELNQKGSRTRSIPMVPTTHSRFYITVPADPGANINLGSKPFEGVKPGVFSVNGETRLVDLPDYELGAPPSNSSWQVHDFTLDKRVMFVPQANTLVTVPYSNDRLIVKRFDMREALDKASIDYLYVTSTPPRKVRKGQLYEYPIEVASRAADVQYELSSGPNGMSVARNGVVSWTVPDDSSEAKVNVIVTIKNNANQTTYESYSIVLE